MEKKMEKSYSNQVKQQQGNELDCTWTVCKEKWIFRRLAMGGKVGDLSCLPLFLCDHGYFCYQPRQKEEIEQIESVPKILWNS